MSQIDSADSRESSPGRDGSGKVHEHFRLVNEADEAIKKLNRSQQLELDNEKLRGRLKTATETSAHAEAQYQANLALLEEQLRRARVGGNADGRDTLYVKDDHPVGQPPNLHPGEVLIPPYRRRPRSDRPLKGQVSPAAPDMDETQELGFSMHGRDPYGEYSRQNLPGRPIPKPEVMSNGGVENSAFGHAHGQFMPSQGDRFNDPRTTRQPPHGFGMMGNLGGETNQRRRATFQPGGPPSFPQHRGQTQAGEPRNVRLPAHLIYDGNEHFATYKGMMQAWFVHEKLDEPNLQIYYIMMSLRGRPAIFFQRTMSKSNLRDGIEALEVLEERFAPQSLQSARLLEFNTATQKPGEGIIEF